MFKSRSARCCPVFPLHKWCLVCSLGQHLHLHVALDPTMVTRVARVHCISGTRLSSYVCAWMAFLPHRPQRRGGSRSANMGRVFPRVSLNPHLHGHTGSQGVLAAHPWAPASFPAMLTLGVPGTDRSWGAHHPLPSDHCHCLLHEPVPMPGPCLLPHWPCFKPTISEGHLWAGSSSGPCPRGSSPAEERTRTSPRGSDPGRHHQSGKARTRWPTPMSVNGMSATEHFHDMPLSEHRVYAEGDQTGVSSGEGTELKEILPVTCQP